MRRGARGKGGLPRLSSKLLTEDARTFSSHNHIQQLTWTERCRADVDHGS